MHIMLALSSDMQSLTSYQMLRLVRISSPFPRHANMGSCSATGAMVTDAHHFGFCPQICRASLLAKLFHLSGFLHLFPGTGIVGCQSHAEAAGVFRRSELIESNASAPSARHQPNQRPSCKLVPFLPQSQQLAGLVS